MRYDALGNPARAWCCPLAASGGVVHVGISIHAFGDRTSKFSPRLKWSWAYQWLRSLQVIPYCWMPLCTSQGLPGFDQTIRQIPFCIAILFLRFNWNKFCLLFRPILCAFYIGYLMKVEFRCFQSTLSGVIWHLFQTFILLKSKFESWIDTVVEPYVINGKVSAANLSIFESQWSVERPDFLLPKKPIKLKVGFDWLNWWIGSSDWLVKI